MGYTVDVIFAVQQLNSRAPIILASITLLLDICVSVLLVGTLNVAAFFWVIFWEPHTRFLVSYVATLLIFDMKWTPEIGPNVKV